MELVPIRLTGEHVRLRNEVREFLAAEAPWGSYRPGLGMDGEHSPEFSRKLGARGWLCMTLPVELGGHGRTATDRFVVTEELLAAGAPLAASWVADRQIAHAIAAHGTAGQKERFIPAIARGECYFSLGMSEPDSGSDLASVSTRAMRDGDGWVLNGSKIWTTYAHLNHYVMVLCRTSREGDRHAGLSQLIVDLKSPGVTVTPVIMLNGEHHFNQVFFGDVRVPDSMMLGEPGAGWHQVTSELAYERSGSDRVLSTFAVYRAWLEEHAGGDPADSAEAIGEFAARLWGLRQMSLSIAGTMDRTGHAPSAESAMVKDMGTAFEQDSLQLLRRLPHGELSNQAGSSFAAMLAQATMKLPVTTIRGGTTEVLRTVAARDLIGRL
jgi:alkylation response protein AidB-like acyl-CoA dehydrogenase